MKSTPRQQVLLREKPYFFCLSLLDPSLDIFNFKPGHMCVDQAEQLYARERYQDFCLSDILHPLLEGFRNVSAG